MKKDPQLVNAMTDESRRQMIESQPGTIATNVQMFTWQEMIEAEEAPEHLRKVLDTIFPDFEWDDSVEETVRRVLSYWREYQPRDEYDFDFTTFPTTSNQLVVVADIPFHSICSHHLLPFHGVAHVAYIPNKKMVGLSKIPRLVRHWAKRPNMQEMLAENVASDLKNKLDAMGSACILKATHTCQTCRGVESPGSMITSVMKGILLNNPHAKDEVFQLLRLSHKA